MDHCGAGTSHSLAECTRTMFRVGRSIFAVLGRVKCSIRVMMREWHKASCDAKNRGMFQGEGETFHFQDGDLQRLAPSCGL